MSRGGRRRKARRRAAPAAGPSRSRAKPAESPSTADSSRGASRAEDESVVAQMRTPSQPLKTLPDDDLVLDELIEGLQREYGVPPTPQEYRLLIRTPTAEHEAAEVLPGADEADDSGSAESSARRRRRRRLEVPEAQEGDAAAGRPGQFE